MPGTPGCGGTMPCCGIIPAMPGCGGIIPGMPGCGGIMPCCGIMPIGAMPGSCGAMPAGGAAIFSVRFVACIEDGDQSACGPLRARAECRLLAAAPPRRADEHSRRAGPAERAGAADVAMGRARLDAARQRAPRRPERVR